MHFFRTFLRHSKGEWAGQPFELLPWQFEIIDTLFGWKRKDETRRFRTAYVEVPKKNGKSALCSGLTLYMLVGDGEPGAEVYTAAADRAQAAIVFNESAHMVESSPFLSDHIEITRSQKHMSFPRTKSIYKALSADVPTKEGLNISARIFDELHVQKTRDLWDALKYGGAARRQPLGITITTAGIFDPEAIGWERHKYSRDLLDGTIDDWTHFAAIFAADPDDDPFTEATWKKANPSYGVTIRKDDMEAAAAEAKAVPSVLNSFLRYRLNIWTQQADRWLMLDKWDACQAELPAIEDMAGEPCVAGLDLASTTDMVALVLVFPRDDKFLVYPWFWIPEEAAKYRERNNATIYRNWITAGKLNTTPGDVTDYSAISQTITSLRDQDIWIQQIAYDPWNATQLATELSETEGFELVQFRQGYASLNEPSKALERAISQGQIVHDGNPIMRWMVNNVAIDEDPAGNIKPSKKKSTEKIDGVVAMIMGLGVAMAECDESYEMQVI